MISTSYPKSSLGTRGKYKQVIGKTARHREQRINKKYYE